MKNLTLKNITKACNGIYHGEEAFLDKEISSVTTDSRTVTDGSLFFAITGERRDGHDYIPGTYEKGALCCISERELPCESHPYIQVSSSLEALKALASFYRDSLDIKVIGITGSVGKTSTKEMIASVLEQKYNVLKTLGNFNNAIGLPLTIFRLREEHEIAVLEMGISEFGEMTVLTNIAKPDVVVMTNIGQCHLESLKSRDGILKAKSEIFECINPNGAIFLNGDDDKLSTLKEVKGITPHFFGLDTQLEAYADAVKDMGLEGTACTIHLTDNRISTTISVPGHHMLYNALAGASIGRYLGLSDEQIKAGIEALRPVSGRNNLIKTNGMSVIDDCYNANPVSMKASIDVISSAIGRKVCILGDMFELGKKEKQLHYEVGTHLASKNIDVLITVGTLAKELATGASVDSHLEIHSFDTLEALTKELSSLLKAGDTILVKASHGMEFTKIVELLTKEKQ